MLKFGYKPNKYVKQIEDHNYKINKFGSSLIINLHVTKAPDAHFC